MLSANDPCLVIVKGLVGDVKYSVSLVYIVSLRLNNLNFCVEWFPDMVWE